MTEENKIKQEMEEWENSISLKKERKQSFRNLS